MLGVLVNIGGSQKRGSSYIRKYRVDPNVVYHVVLLYFRLNELTSSYLKREVTGWLSMTSR